MVLAATAVLPTVALRCDRMARNINRGFFEGIGQNLSDVAFDAVVP
jgi:hypothetical protein